MDLQRDVTYRDVWSPGHPWPVNWSGVWVGALASLASALVFGLAGLALGLHLTGASQRVTEWNTLGNAAIACGVFSAFFAGVIGGWVGARVAGLYYAEPAMLHGAVVWLVGLPMFLLAAAFGGGAYLGGWYNGLAGTPAWAASAAAAPAEAAVTPAPRDTGVPQAAADPTAARAARNGALLAITTLIMSFVGSVLGGWMASGEPMSISYYYRDRAATRQAMATGTTAERVTPTVP